MRALLVMVLVAGCSRLPGATNERLRPGGRRTPVPAAATWLSGRISSGSSHTCAASAGRVLCWGWNSQGEVGDGTTERRANFVVVPGISDAVAVSAGYQGTCALHATGAVSCWGSPDEAQRAVHRIAGVDDAEQVMQSARMVCARRLSGRVTCWRSFAAGTSDLPGVTGARGLAAGFAHLCVLGIASVTCFQARDDAPYGEPERLGEVAVEGFALAGGDREACVLGARGRVRCFTVDERARTLGPLVDLGVEGILAIAGGDRVCLRGPSHAACVRTLGESLVPAPALYPLHAVALGALRTCGVRSEGTIVCWGLDDGTLGRYSLHEAQPKPAQVAGVSAALELAVTEYGACVRETAGVACWGGGVAGQPGPDGLSRTALQGLTRLESGRRYVCAIGSGAACWGEISWRPCFWDSPDNCQPMRFLTPALTAHLLDIPGAQKLGGLCALRGDGHVLCARPDVDRTREPLDVGVSGAIALSGSCAVLSGGQVACWQDGGLAQVIATPPVTQVVSGWGHSCALASGAVWCWGRGESGQLGDGSAPSQPRATAAAVLGLEDAVELAAGDAFTCARRAGGTVVCWGKNEYGALGDGSGRDQLTPAPALLSGIVELGAAASRVCARRTGGDVWCWGQGESAGYPTVTPDAPVTVGR